MISSFHLYLNSVKYLYSFSNSSRCFFILSSLFFRFLRRFVQYFSSFVIVSTHSVFQILPTIRWRPYSNLRYISLNPFYKYKWCAKSVACHQSKLVKDTHIVILILVSSCKIQFLIPEIHQNSWSHLFIFFPEFQVFSRLYHFKAPP